MIICADITVITQNPPSWVLHVKSHIHQFYRNCDCCSCGDWISHETRKTKWHEIRHLTKMRVFCFLFYCQIQEDLAEQARIFSQPASTVPSRSKTFIQLFILKNTVMKPNKCQTNDQIKFKFVFLISCIATIIKCDSDVRLSCLTNN